MNIFCYVPDIYDMNLIQYHWICSKSGKTHTEQWAGGHKSYKNRAGRWHPGHPAGDHYDARLSPSKYNCLFWIVFAARQALDMHGILRWWQLTGHLPGDGPIKRTANLLHVPWNAEGLRIFTFETQNASWYKRREYIVDGMRWREIGRFRCIGTNYSNYK